MGNTVSLSSDIPTCKLFYLLKYTCGILFILLAAYIPLWLLFILCLLFTIFTMTPLMKNMAGFFHITDEEKVKSFAGDTKAIAGWLTLSIPFALLLPEIGIPLPSFLIFQAFAVTLFSTRSWFSLFNDVTLFEDLRQKESFTNISLVNEFFLIMLRVLGAFFAGWWMAYHSELVMTTDLINQLFFIALIGAFIGSLFESIPLRFNVNAVVFVSSLFSMWILFVMDFQMPWMQTALAALFSVILAFLAYRYKLADVSALFSAAVSGVIIILFSTLGWYILLVTFFILGGGFTHYKFKQKIAAGLAESKTGARNYKNVFSNGLTAIGIAVLYGLVNQSPDFAWLSMPLVFAYVGTVATATGDTLASEIGVTSKGPTYMITNFRKARVGEDGGVSLLGEAAALAGTLIIGILAFLFGMIDSLPLSLLVAVAGGFLGTNIDSVLGAVLQKRGLLTNSSVNLVATILGGLISFGLYFLIY